jgi:pimeloyl-ACP methyl ester carboxylesterase
MSWLDRIEAEQSGPRAAEPAVKVVDVDGVSLSARTCPVPDPTAVVLALHGGSASSRYFDPPGHPELSLLRLGAERGFTTIALDRPGYGMSRIFADELTDPRRRVDLLFGALDALLGSAPRGAGVFVVGHSLGCESTVRMAADERGAALLGVELAGTGVRYDPAARAQLDRWRDVPASQRPPGARDLLFQPAHLYPDDLDGEAIGGRSPDYEAEVSRTWTGGVFRDLAARVRVPVHLTLGDQESIWSTGPDALAELAALFTAAPTVVAEEQADTGHNLSVGLSAREYHQRVLSFVEECARSDPRNR